MYQVRAEAVNGLQVLSKGRWLTCIGNKPVRKGDLVWTDGRCVYGFYKEGQTPLVIFNPVVEEVLIPIYIYEFNEQYKEHTSLYNINEYFVKNDKLIPSTNSDFFAITNIIKLPDGAPIIDGYAATLAWNDQTTCYFSRTMRSISFNAMNYDLQLKKFCFITDNTQILSNDEVLQSIYFSRDEIRFKLIELIGLGGYKNIPVFPDTLSESIVFSFIENATDWIFAIIFNYFDVPSTTLMYICSSNFNTIELHATRYRTGRIQMDTSSVRDIKFPIQDRYYFQIESDAVGGEYNGDRITYLLLSDISIHSPSGGVICRGKFPLFPYFTIYKLDNNKYLIGIRVKYGTNSLPYQQWHLGSLHYDFWDPEDNIPSDLDFYRPGLYLCTNGILKPLLVRTGDVWVTIINQRFTPIKSQKLKYIIDFRKADGDIE